MYFGSRKKKKVVLGFRHLTMIKAMLQILINFIDKQSISLTTFLMPRYYISIRFVSFFVSVTSYSLRPSPRPGKFELSTGIELCQPSATEIQKSCCLLVGFLSDESKEVFLVVGKDNNIFRRRLCDQFGLRKDQERRRDII